MKTNQRFFSVTVADVLAAKSSLENCFEYIRTEGIASCAIDYIRVQTKNGINPEDDYASVIISSEFDYLYERVFEGADALEKAVKYANSKLTTEFL
jgi:hypothetical protein